MNGRGVSRSFARRPLGRLAGAVVLSFAVVAALFVVRAIARSTTPVPACSGSHSLEFGCLAGRYEALTRVSGVSAALADLDTRRATSGYVRGVCHQLTHVVGRTAGALDGGAAFTKGSDVCASGYYHGVIEAVMMGIGAEQMLGRAHAVCAEHRQRNRHSYLHYNCVHGMGHGFMAVFESDVFKSLPGCDALPDAWEQHHCYGGVFMENLTAAGNPSRRSKQLRPDEPLYPCTAVPARYKEECYVKQTAYALHVRNDDFAAVFTLCWKDADPDFRFACYEGIGGDATIMSSKYVSGVPAQVATVRQLCLLGPDDDARSHCVAGAVTTIARDLAGDDRKARALCAALDDAHLAVVCERTREAASRGVPTPRSAHVH
jgi:hypothetical protein